MNQTRLLAAALLLAATEAVAQTWTQILPAPYPTILARRQGGIAYDGAVGRLLMYGGLQSGPTLTLNDTWSYDGVLWTQLTPATTPPPRWGHRMVYDSRRARIVTFGGRSPTTTAAANDTWEWDGSDWAQVITVGAPSPRAFYSMAYDERRGKCVIYGVQSGSVAAGGNQTWEYDGTTWTMATPAFVPPGLEAPAMTYDKGRGVTVMFGGFNGTPPGTDYRLTWEFDGVDWVQRTTANAPPTGYRTGCTYDDHRGRVLVYGGLAAGAMQRNVWEYDGNDWTLVAAANPGPPKSTEGYMAFLPTISQTVYFGGSGLAAAGGVANETWHFAGASTAIAAPFGQGCASSAGPAVLTPTTTPVLGNNYVLDLANGAFTGIGVMTHGFSNTTWVLGNLPAELTGFGFGGCRLEVSPDATALLLVSGGLANQTIAVPNLVALLNLQLFSQVLILDAAAPNGSGGMSQAVHAVLGQ